MLPYVWQFLARPGWLAAFLADGGLMQFPNVDIPGQGPLPYADVGAALEQSTVTWRDLRWIRDLWNGPIVIKGIHTGEDARRAALVRTRKLLGCASVAELDRSYVDAPADWLVASPHHLASGSGRS